MESRKNERTKSKKSELVHSTRRNVPPRRVWKKLYAVLDHPDSTTWSEEYQKLTVIA